MAHIKNLKFLKNHKDLIDENYGMVAVPTFSDGMDKDLAKLFKLLTVHPMIKFIRRTCQRG